MFGDEFSEFQGGAFGASGRPAGSLTGGESIESCTRFINSNPPPQQSLMDTDRCGLAKYAGFTAKAGDENRTRDIQHGKLTFYR